MFVSTLGESAGTALLPSLLISLCIYLPACQLSPTLNFFLSMNES